MDRAPAGELILTESVLATCWPGFNKSGERMRGFCPFHEGSTNPFYATGRPIVEPYWANVKVVGTYQDVLMQCFERRCLTYTPGNSDGWQVEAGNVGQHYYRWRYGE